MTTKCITVLFLAGSVGAFMAEQFAGYNFDQTAGFTLIDGMVLMDGTLAPGAPGQGATPDDRYLNLDDEFQPLAFARFGIGFLKTGAGSPVSSVAERVSPDPTVPQPNGNPNGVTGRRTSGQPCSSGTA
ncbi:MAG: hypothetical protein HY650_10450 [Acidobacteria bacterium]|nr:hypothetical protein [Acidobacteriota bacterium]